MTAARTTRTDLVPDPGASVGAPAAGVTAASTTTRASATTAASATTGASATTAASTTTAAAATPGGPAVAARLRATDLTLAYGDRTVVRGLDLVVPEGELTVVVGPNACGKSTVLRALARLLRPTTGTVLLDGRSLRDFGSKELARTLGLLPQTSTAPSGITVADLVTRGRYPHQRLGRRLSREDAAVVARALAATGVADLSARPVEELSGGQRQRVWVAMVLAQETGTLLLDEPTTFLDITHQYDLLELFVDLHRAGRTVVAVLHDLNQACRYGTHLVAMRDGAVVAQGAPADVVTPAMVREVFGLEAMVVPDPAVGTPMVVPLGRPRR